MKRIVAITALLLFPLSTPHAADLEFSETLALPQCHSLSWVNAWVKADSQATDQRGWDGILDEARWGVPSPQQLVGRNWDPAQGGYQKLPTAPFADFAGDKATASWLVNASYAADWQAFQRDGEVKQPASSKPAPNHP